MAKLQLLGALWLAGCIASTPCSAEQADATPDTSNSLEAPHYLSEHPEASSPFVSDDTAQIMDGLAARANDWHEPSARSEERYVLAIRQWLDSLEPEQQRIAHNILAEAHPVMRALRIAIREKKSELASLSFDRNTTAATLPRLGQELASLRRTLNTKLKEIGERLNREAGVNMGPLGGDGFWLSPADEHALHPVPPRHGSLQLPGNLDALSSFGAA